MSSFVSAKRFSVSAIRDYCKCPKYYQLKRVYKLPEDKTMHHRWAGSLVHAAFMLAYGTPYKPSETNPEVPAWRTSWQVDNAGTVGHAMDLFDCLWAGELLPDMPERVEQAYGVLAPELPVPRDNQFARGQLKALKNPNNTERKQAWGEHYKNMLVSALETGYQYPVVELERPVVYQLGSTAMLGFIDIVLASPEGEIYVDLKSGMNKPSPRLLAYDDQMGSYHHAVNEHGDRPAAVWYHHMRSGEIYEVDYSRDMALMLADNADSVSVSVSQEHFPRRVTPDCSACDMYKSCVKELNGKLKVSAVTASQPSPEQNEQLNDLLGLV